MKYLVLGLGKSGISAAKLLSDENEVTCWDAKTEENFDSAVLDTLKNKGVKLFFGNAEINGHFDECIISPGIKPDNKYTLLADKLSGEIELAYRNCRGKFVGITGSNGKTTTTTLVGELLKGSSVESLVAGNIGVPVCDVVKDAQQGCFMITELSSFQLETIHDFRPVVSAVLNLTPDHLDRHGSAEEYYRCKCRIFENQTEEDYLVYNADDPVTVAHVASCRALKLPFTRKKSPVELSMEANAAFLNGNIITLRIDGKDRNVMDVSELQLLGSHNIENVLAACLIAGLCGVKARSMAKVLRSFKGVEHRMEFVRELRGVKYINDSKGTNPDSSIKALEAVSTPVLLIAGGYEKNADFTDFIKAFDGKVKYLILLGKTADRIAKTAVSLGFRDDYIIKCSSLEACVASAAKLADKGDTVLLSPACASWDMFQSYEVRGNEFKKTVKEL